MNYSKSMIKDIFRVAIVFCLIYEVRLLNTSTLFTSRKLIFVTLVTLFILSNRNNYKIIINNKITSAVFNILIVGILIVIYVLFITLINSCIGTQSGTLIFPRAVYFVIFGPVTWLLAKDYYDDYNQFMRALLIATLLQVFIVIAQFHFRSFALFLNANFALDAHTTYLDTIRASGLGAGDSLLSIDLFLGSVACTYFIVKSKFLIRYLVAYVLILYGTVISGSIGTLLTIGFFVITIVYQLIRQKKRKALFVIFIVFIAGAVAIISNPEVFQKIEESYIWQKIDTLITGQFANSRTMRDLKMQIIAPISLNTILGTGIYRGISGSGIICTSDFGYIQTYFGYGLFVAIIFYVVLYRGMYIGIKHINDRDVKSLMFLLAGSIALAEVKEPYIFHYGELFVFFVSCFSYFKKNQHSIG